MDYKKAKEDFVSGLKGSSPGRVGLIVLSTVAVTILQHGAIHFFQPRAPSTIFIVEFCTLALPLIGLYTVASDVVVSTFVIIGIICLGVLFSRLKKDALSNKQSPQKISFITQYRACMMLSTCIAILAVDFPAFPREFAKTETWGISLMDSGVGSFMMSMGLVSSSRKLNPNIASRLKQAFFITLPMLILGFARLLTIKSTNYQEHVAEYGVHWNFFVTLAGISAISNLIDLSPLRGALMGCFAIIIYQYALNNGLALFIIEAPRTNLITQNKEGVFSLSGYLCLFLISKLLGTWLKQNWQNSKFKCAITLTVISAVLWLSIRALEESIQPISRRMANLPYVMFVLAGNLEVLSGFMWIEIFFGPNNSLLLESISYNQLPVFLLSNLLTGAVNLSMRTIYQPWYICVVTLMLYMAIVNGAAVAMKRKSISLNNFLRNNKSS